MITVEKINAIIQLA